MNIIPLALSEAKQLFLPTLPEAPTLSAVQSGQALAGTSPLRIEISLPLPSRGNVAKFLHERISHCPGILKEGGHRRPSE